MSPITSNGDAPPGPRIAILAHRDPRGEVGERVDLLVAGLRDIVDRVVLVADALSPAGRERAEAVADRVVVAPAPTAIALLAAGLAAADDEVRGASAVLVTDTERYGPLVGEDPEPMRALLDRAEDRAAWLLVDTAPRQALEPSPWLWVDAGIASGELWRTWWWERRGDTGAAGMHELVTALREAGVPVEALWTHSDARIERLTLEEPFMPVPFVERALLVADPLPLEDASLSSRVATHRLRRDRYPMEVVARDLSRAIAPRAAHTNLGGLTILPYGHGQAMLDHRRVAAITHLYYPEATSHMQLALQLLPPETTWIITTGSEESKAAIERELEEHSYLPGPRAIDVRVVASNRGRDISAFLLGAADALRPRADGTYAFDVVLKLHSKRSPQDGFPRSQRFSRHVMAPFVHNTGGLLDLFADEPELGMVMPPQIHVGYPTLGRAWFGNRPAAERMASRLGIDVPFDEGSPLAPFGSMFAARPEALRPLVDSLGWQDFPDESGYRDGGTAHVVERLFAYAAVSEGYTVRTVTSPELAAESHQLLEWKLQEILRDVPGTARQQVQLAQAATRAAAIPAGAAVRAARAAGRGAAGLVRGAREAVRRRREDG